MRDMIVHGLVFVLVLVAAAVPLTAQPRCAPSRPDALGPFDTENAPERSATGRGPGGAGRGRGGLRPDAGVSQRPAATVSVSRTVRRWWARPSAVNGLAMNGISAEWTPRRTMASSVYPDM